jgi:predicted nucleic acid-binding protein
MIYGLDTGFLVAAEVIEHSHHSAARSMLAQLVTAGDQFAIAPQILAECMHIVTDSRRFSQPLEMHAARDIAEQWWLAVDVVHVFPADAAIQQFLSWLQQFLIGPQTAVGHPPRGDIPARGHSVAADYQRS